MKLVIVDLGCGNIGSLTLAMRRLGTDPVVSADATVIADADRLVLPGVGAAGFAMERIDALDLREALLRFDKPALGICLGMQIMFDKTEEDNAQCLGIIPGHVRRLDSGPGRPVPHMGWSKVQRLRPQPELEDDQYLYFAHSFASDVGKSTVASASYGRDFSAVVRYRNWLGAQFHPERSGDAGSRFLKAFLS